MGKDNTEDNIGERLSFFKLFCQEEFRVEIPIIQRDYAQGRKSNNIIRNNFLNALKKYLDEGRPNRDLDFIYGSLVKDDQNKTFRFIPLDGQQRLTTLFLLHWYIAIKEDRLIEFRNHFAVSFYVNNKESWRSKFTYETRTSAKEFCNALASASIKFSDFKVIEKEEDKPVADAIKDQQWYFLSWKRDPTIQGMLVMLDAIHEIFNNEKKYYDLLINPDNPIITFQFLELEEFGLTDDLYIKMNARGKSLTPFENFKAKFEQQIKPFKGDSENYIIRSGNDEKNMPLQKYFSHKIDTDWANLFWAYLIDNLPTNSSLTSTLFDNMVMNFFKTFAINYIARNTGSKDNVKDLIDAKSIDLSFLQFEQHKCFDSENVPKLISLLDILHNGDKKAKKFIPNFYYYDENLLKDFLDNSFNTAAYTERLQIHAYFEYLIKWSNNNIFDDSAGLENWMRIIHNLTENTTYNSETDFINSIIGINALLEESNNIHEYLINKKTITGFDKLQIREEIIKAKLIEKGSNWRNLIYKAEQHGYFKGQIGFLLRLCGITDYFNENSEWDDEQDISFGKALSEYLVKATMIFDKDGLKNAYDKPGNYIWQRALLTIDDYLIQEGRNQSFLINKGRDISWKRLLKGDKENNHNQITKNIFKAFDIEKPIESLEFLINNFSANDWRIHFIDNPELFNYLGKKRYVREKSDHGFTMFKGERMTGQHAELYSYLFYLNNQKDETFLPFTKPKYYEATGDAKNKRPCAYIEQWNYKNTHYAIDIYYSDNRYKLRFFYREKGEYYNEVIDVLEKSGFEEKNNNYKISCQTEIDALKIINTLCESFKEL